jgi:hypothetical protein
LKQFFLVVAGFVVAPIVPALALAVFSSAFNHGVGAIAGASVFFYFLALVPTVALGAPAFLILLRFNLVRWWSAAVVGSLIGVVVAVVIGANVAASAFGFFAAAGALAALVFWVFWVIARRTAVYHHGQVPAA